VHAALGRGFSPGGTRARTIRDAQAMLANVAAEDVPVVDLLRTSGAIRGASYMNDAHWTLWARPSRPASCRRLLPLVPPAQGSAPPP